MKFLTSALGSIAIMAGMAPGGARAQEIPAHPGQIGFADRVINIPDANRATHTLESGARIVVIPDYSVPLVQVVVALRAGRFLDPESKPGVAELTGALIRRGGSLSRSADVLDEAIDFLGADINTRAGATRAGASLECLSETLAECLEIFFELLTEPGFQADRLESARSSILASLEARNDNPLDVLEREWAWLQSGRQHYSGRQLTRADVEGLSRQDLKSFHRTYWDPRQAVIAVSGDVDPAAVLALLRPLVESWASAVPDPGVVTWPPARTQHEVQPGLFLAPHETVQAKVAVGHSMPPGPPWESRQLAALEIANEILGGTTGLISRINSRLRGREGLVYRALSEVETGPNLSGSFRMILDAAPENVPRVIDICIEEIERIQNHAVSARELAVVKEELLSQLQLRFDSGENTAGYFAEDLLIGRSHDYWRRYETRIRAVTPADIQRAARKLFRPDDLVILVVGGGEGVYSTRSVSRRIRHLLEQATRLPRLDSLTLEPTDSQ